VPPGPVKVTRRPLVCKDARSIRDFKDYALAEVNPEPDEVERWAVCLCGVASRQAGVNARRPRPAEAPLTAPSYDVHSQEGSLAQIQEWLKGALPLTEEQAAKLADCLYIKE